MTTPACLVSALFGGIPPATRQWTDAGFDGARKSTYTFAAKNIGAAAPNRRVLVCVGAENDGDGATTITSVTVGGIAATSIIPQYSPSSDNQINRGIFIADVPAGATADIVVTLSAWKSNCNISVYRVTSYSATPVATYQDTDGSNPLSATVVAPADSIIIGWSGKAAPITWTGLTKDYDYGANNGSSSASKVAAAPESGLAVTATNSAGLASSLSIVVLR